MELRLTPEELGLLHEILSSKDETLRRRLEQFNEQELEHELQQEHLSIKGLLANVAARRLGFAFEDLDDLARLLADCEREFAQKTATEEDPGLKLAMERKQIVLRSLRDKVTEACVML